MGPAPSTFVLVTAVVARNRVVADGGRVLLAVLRRRDGTPGIGASRSATHGVVERTSSATFRSSVRASLDLACRRWHLDFPGAASWTSASVAVAGRWCYLGMLALRVDAVLVVEQTRLHPWAPPYQAVR